MVNLTPDFSQWGKLKARIIQVAECKLRNNSDGIAIVTVKIVMNRGWLGL